MIQSRIQWFNFRIQWFNLMIQWFNLGFNDSISGFNDSILGFKDSILGFNYSILGFNNLILELNDSFCFLCQFKVGRSTTYENKLLPFDSTLSVCGSVTFSDIGNGWAGSHEVWWAGNVLWMSLDWCLKCRSSVTKFFQQSLPKFFFQILLNVGFPNNYVIIMPKNNSCLIKVEKNVHKRCAQKSSGRNTCRFHRI
jgi:hypothetical protein